MPLTKNTTSIAYQTTGNTETFVTGSTTTPGALMKWDSSGNASSSGFDISQEDFGGSLSSSTSTIPTQLSVNNLINSRLGTVDGSQLGAILINPENNAADGVGGISISAKENGEQTITYTPPNALTADQIISAGSENGEFVTFNSAGKLVSSNTKKSLVIESSSTDNTLPTTKATFDYGQNIAANRLLGVDNTIGHGDFLSYNSATGGFETTTASISNHKLFSANHTDVATNVTPSYGDSIYYDGNEWTTGNFGNWGADMEYKGITSQTGATFSDLSYDVSYVRGPNTQPANLKQFIFNSGFGDAFPSGMPAAPSVGSNLSGNFSLLGFSSEGAPVSTVATPNIYALSGKIQFPISGFIGGGLNNSRIRGVYIKSKLVHDGTGMAGENEIYVIYPDGSRQPLLAGASHTALSNSGGYSRPNIQQTIFVPINEGQTQLQIEFDHNFQKKIVFEIIGALCTKRIELSPEVDHIQIVGSQATEGNAEVITDGYVDGSGGSWAARSVTLGGQSNRSDIWSSLTPTTPPSNNWSDVLPITIPDNVSKTVIKSKSAWAMVSPSEEHSTTEIVIDWNEQTITGTYFSDNEASQSGYLYSDNLTGVKTFNIDDSGNFRPTIRVEVSGRDIIKLPVPRHMNFEGNNNQPYQNFALSFNIENHKTIASTTKRLAQGFTTLATDQLATVAAPISGTVDTDGYLIVTANFGDNINTSGREDFAIDIGGTVFENANRGIVRPMSDHETLTLPIAAGETYSVTANAGPVIDQQTLSARTTFDIRFKAKSIEATPVDGVDGAPGATGPQGPQGIQGEPGTNGIGTTGNTGATGPQGPQGATGPRGLQGTIGSQGPAGTAASFPAGTLGVNGYQKFPSGLIMQWGTHSAGSNNTGAVATSGELVTFPIQFPNSCINLVTGMVNATASNPNYMTHARVITKSNFRMVYDSTDQASGTIQGSWQAFGY